MSNTAVKDWVIQELLWGPPQAYKMIQEDHGISWMGDGDIEFEREVKGYGYVNIIVPVEVLRAYLTSYDKWKASK